MSEIKATHFTSVALAGLLALGIQQTAQAAPANDDMQPAQARSTHHMQRHAQTHRQMRRDSARYYNDRRQMYGARQGYAGHEGLGNAAMDQPQNFANNGDAEFINFLPAMGQAADNTMTGGYDNGYNASYAQQQGYPPPAYGYGYGHPFVLHSRLVHIPANNGYAYASGYNQPDYSGYYNGTPNPVAGTGAVVGGVLNAATLGIFNGPGYTQPSYGYGPTNSQPAW